MNKKYFIDEKNYIGYEIIENFVFVRYLFFANQRDIPNSIRQYINYFVSLENIDFLGFYPGTYNPIIVKSLIETIKELNFKYRIFYNKFEIKNIQEFEENTLQDYYDKMSLTCSDSISACDDLNLGFQRCAVFSSLSQNQKTVKTPIKYYEVNDEGFLVEEFDELPNDNKKYHESIKIKDMFPICNIKIENGKIKYFPKT